MNGKRRDYPTATTSTPNRRRVMGASAGAALAVLGLDLTGAGATADDGATPAPTGRHGNLDQAIEGVRTAIAAFVDGDPEPYKAAYSHRDDATLFGAWGAYERGWADLGPRFDWAAARFAGGEVEFEEIARVAGAEDLAYTVHLERMRAHLVGSDEIVPVSLRVTHLYRLEAGTWKLTHRHADPIVAIATAESVVEQ